MGMFYSQDSLADVARLVPWHRTQEAMCKASGRPMNKGFGQCIWTNYLKILSDGQVDLL